MTVRSPIPTWLTQIAFALAPIPAYLPQYWTFCSTSNDPILKRNVPKRFTGNTTSRSQIQQQQHEHHHESYSTDTDKKYTQTAAMDGQILVSTGANSSMNGSTLSSHPKSNVAADSEGGFSTTSILILLLSHTFRLVYFSGCAITQIFGGLEDSEDRIQSDMPTSMVQKEERLEIDKIQFDLVLQSMTMIGIQYLLLSAVTRRRRVMQKRKSNQYEDSKSSSLSPSDGIKMNAPSSGQFLRSPSWESQQQQQQQPINSYHHHSSSTEKRSNISQRPFVWLYKPSHFFTWHTSRQYVELLIFITFMTMTICHRYIYPTDAYACVIFLRNMSVLLESCLALPQMILNYKRKDTTGLSLIMIGGWIGGDLMKLVYFMPHQTADAEYQPSLVASSDTAESSAGQAVFIMGSVFALIMDLLVGLQCWHWFPTDEVAEWKDSMTRRWRRLQSSIIAPIGWSVRRVTYKKQRKGSVGGNVGHCC